MHANLQSPHWYRVAGLRPRLRAGIAVSRQQVRGEVWRVLTDPVSGRHHRFDAVAWSLLAACDGRRTLDEVWTARSLAPDAPTQDEAIRLIAQAHEAQLLLCDVPPEAATLIRSRRRQQGRRRRAAINPLAFRVPLWDPDRFLQRHVARVSPLFGRVAALALLAWLLLGAGVLAVQANDFLAHSAALAGSSRFWLMAWLLYPVLKALHELAHAFAVKHHGGEVHAMGVTLLMFTPVPYVDASAAAGFADRRQRAQVAAAGIAVELALASAALWLWWLLEPGLLRDAAAAVAVIGGLSTLLVNGNPLLRFDGYHVFCDLMELPNLGTRSRQWWLAVLKRLLLGSDAARLPRESPGERPWLVAYAPLSWLMQVGLWLFAVRWLSEVQAWLGALLLVFGAWSMLLMPLGRTLGWVGRAPELHGRRSRAVLASALAFGTAGLLAFTLPLPHRSHAPGLVWLPDDAFVRNASEGFLVHLEARDGQAVQAGDIVARLENDALQVRLALAQAELERARVDQLMQIGDNAAGAAQAADRLAQWETEVARLAQQVDALVLRAGRDGQLAIDPQRIRPGMHLPQGHTVAQVLPPGGAVVHAFVHNNDIALASADPRPAEITLASGGPAWPAERVAGVPQATAALPSAALGEKAGGSIAVSPSDPRGLTATQPRLRIDLRLPPQAPAPVGSRVLVAFDHGDTTLAGLVAGALRRLFLRHVTP